jgi:hypothetical protein
VFSRITEPADEKARDAICDPNPYALVQRLAAPAQARYRLGPVSDERAQAVAQHVGERAVFDHQIRLPREQQAERSMWDEPTVAQRPSITATLACMKLFVYSKICTPA